MSFPTPLSNGQVATVNNISYTWNSTKSVWIKSVGGVPSNTISSLSITGITTVNTGAGVTAIANGGGNGIGNIGTSGSGFNTVFAKSTSAQYADLAEKYKSDKDYAPGTVVVFGGAEEITTTDITHSDKVAGVISTNPAYLMNDTEQQGIWLPVALQGRVPCKVKGPVNKGDLVVSSDMPGVAVKVSDEFYKPGCVIGKSLEDYTGNSVKDIEVVIGRI
jgi:hypothetical protein